MPFPRTTKELRDLVGPWICALSKGAFLEEYKDDKIVKRFSGTHALLTTVIGIAGIIFAAVGWLTGIFYIPEFFGKKSNFEHEMTADSACKLSGKTINLIYKFCIKDRCYKTREKVSVNGDKVFWYSNPEGAPSEIYQLGATVQLKPPPSTAEGTYWKAFGTATYSNGVLRLARERIRYETSTTLFSQTESAWYDISVPSCHACGMNHRGEIQTKGASTINYSAFESGCAIDAEPEPPIENPAEPPKIAASGATVESLRIRAEQGDSDAMNMLGVAYAQGDGIPRDPATARVWFRQAANLGNVAAMNNLAYFYDQAVGGARDSKAALEWYGRAADRKNSTAMWNLANMYEENTPGIPRNSSLSAHYLLLALRAGHELARKRLLSGLPTWSISTRKAVQAQLQAEGYYKGSNDGVFESDTYHALTEYAKHRQ